MPMCKFLVRVFYHLYILQFYQEYHHDAVEKIYLKHKVTGSSLTLSTAIGGNFTVGETITGATSGATALVKAGSGSTITYASLGDANIPFQIENVTGGTSGWTGAVTTITNYVHTKYQVIRMVVLGNLLQKWIENN